LGVVFAAIAIAWLVYGAKSVFTLSPGLVQFRRSASVSPDSQAQVS